MILLCVGMASSLSFIFGSYLSPHARMARVEATHWKGRYNAETKFRAEAEAAAGGNAPLGSLNGLEGLAEMFLGGEKFSLPKLLGVLKDNPEMIGQILQLVKSGIPQQAPQKGALPSGGAGGGAQSPYKVLQ